MDGLTAAAASGMRARLEALEMLANNLANAATAGYKTDRESYGLYAAPEAIEQAVAGSSPAPSTLPVIERHWTDFNQGTLTPTGSPLDLALSGRGFFVADGPKGALYTRNGSFRLSRAGVLTTSEGYPVRAAGGRQIQALGTGALEVSPDGEVRQDGQALGRLEIVDFERPGSIEKLGRNYFRPADPQRSPSAAAGTTVHQGKLENSNVGTAESAVRLINILRQFEMLQRAIALGGEMNRRAVEEVARPNP